MPIGQSALAALFASGVAKQGAYLVERAQGASRIEADIRSDEVAITTAYTVGTAVGIATADPIGAAATVAYANLREHDLEQKKRGR